jgi:hypothetical protein
VQILSLDCAAMSQRPSDASTADAPMKDPWSEESLNAPAPVRTPRPAAIVSPPSGSMSVAPRTSTPTSEQGILTPDGRILMSCWSPLFLSIGVGAIGGMFYNAVGKQPAVRGAFCGAAVSATLSSTFCLTVKAREQTIYDTGYSRALSYALGAPMWPVSAEVYNAATGGPRIPLRMLASRVVFLGTLAGGFGAMLDYFHIGQPAADELDQQRFQQTPK